MTTIFEEVELGIKGGYFTPPKPKNEQDDKDKEIIAQLELKRQLMIQRKHDGNGHVTTIGVKPRDIDIYTLGLNPVRDKYPHLIKGLHTARFPGRTVICSEIFCTVGGVHDRDEASRFTNLSTANALEYQRVRGVCPEMAIFNTLVWNGEDARKWSNRDRYFCVLDHLKRNRGIDCVSMTELVETSLEEARRLFRINRWEGLVLYDRNGLTDFALGKPGESPSIPRPKGVWKDKDAVYVDFVAYDFVPSEAKAHKKSVKDFYIGLIDPNTGKLIPCGKCGNGLSKDERFEFAKQGMLPVAVEVKFEKWSKHGKTLQGRIERVRDSKDKSFRQCIATEAQLAHVLAKERIEPRW